MFYKKSLLIPGTILATLISGSAFSDSLTGFYVSGAAGLANLDEKINIFSPTASTVAGRTQNFSAKDNKMFGEAAIGYGVQRDRLYLGANLSVDTNAQSVSENDTQGKNNYTREMQYFQYASFNLQPGVMLSNSFMIYANAGVAYSNLKYIQKKNTLNQYTESENVIVPQLGLGALYMLSNHVSLFANAIKPIFSNQKFSLKNGEQYNNELNDIRYTFGVRYTF